MQTYATSTPETRFEDQLMTGIEGANYRGST